MWLEVYYPHYGWVPVVGVPPKARPSTRPQPKNQVHILATDRLQLIVYMNTTTTTRTDLPEAAYSHDVLGHRISPIDWPDTYLINPSSSLALSAKQSLSTAGSG